MKVVRTLVGNWVDWVIVGIVAWTIAFGVRRGLLWSAVDLVVLLLSIGTAIAMGSRVAVWAVDQLDIEYSLGQLIAFLLIWGIAYSLLAAIGRFLVAPFQWLLWGSTIDPLLSTVPSRHAKRRTTSCSKCWCLSDLRSCRGQTGRAK